MYSASIPATKVLTENSQSRADGLVMKVLRVVSFLVYRSRREGCVGRRARRVTQVCPVAERCASRHALLFQIRTVPGAGGAWVADAFRQPCGASLTPLLRRS